MSVVYYARCPGFLVRTRSLMEDLVQREEADCVAAPPLPI